MTRIPQDLLPKYPPLAERYEDQKGRQCTHWRNYCVACGERFVRVTAQECDACGEKRYRCMRWATHGEDCCPNHRSRPWNIFDAIIGQITDQEYEAVLQGSDERHDKPLTVATLALAQAAQEMLTGRNRNPERLISVTKEYFSIVEKHQKLNEGELIRIDNSQRTIRAWRNRIRDFKRAILDVLMRRLPESQAKEIMEEVREQVRLAGRRVTTPVMLEAAASGEVSFRATEDP